MARIRAMYLHLSLDLGLELEDNNEKVVVVDAKPRDRQKRKFKNIELIKIIILKISRFQRKSVVTLNTKTSIFLSKRC